MCMTNTSAQQDPMREASLRDKTIIRTSVIGIAANVMLAAFKAIVGLLSNSIAITLDAVNNFSDAGSSVITIVGTKLAAKAPTKKHPFGHGRAEYLSAMLISLIIIYAGVTSFQESVRKIITPVTPDYSVASLIVIGVAIVVKIVLGRYVKSVGEKVNSDSLINSGEDATLDSVISASTFIAAIVFIVTGFSFEAWLGAIISIVIIKSGIEMLRDTISKLLGESADAELARSIKDTVLSFEGVSGAYDLIMNNYGPDRFNGSIHIEVPDTYTADRLDVLIREITTEVFAKHNVVLTAVGIYSVNTKNDSAAKMRDEIYKKVRSNEYVLETHGFYADEKTKTVRFDIVVSFDAPDRREVYSEIKSEMEKLYPDYTFQIALDTDFTEEISSSEEK